MLLLHKGGLYKTKQFKTPQYIGDPINAIKIFNDLGVDEVVILDIDATKEQRGPNYCQLSDIASEAFMPLSYGGGIKSIEDSDKILKIGFEKIVLNSVLKTNLDFARCCADAYGSQSVVASVDYGKRLFYGLREYSYLSKKYSRKEVVSCCVEFEKVGVGEILLTNVDRDGLMTGLDLETIKRVAEVVKIPIIACGGAGKLEHLQAAQKSGASAVAAGSMFVYHGNQRGVLINYPPESELNQYLQ